VDGQLKGRRPDFHSSRAIRLADGHVWSFPAPAENGVPSPETAFGAEYLDLIRAILEAEDSNEARLAELAFAMHLIGRNRPLTPAEYQRLFMFEQESQALTESQDGFRDLARDHVDYLVATGTLSRPAWAGEPAHGALGRLLSRLRNQWPIRTWYPTSRKSEVLS